MQWTSHHYDGMAGQMAGQGWVGMEGRAGMAGQSGHDRIGQLPRCAQPPVHSFPGRKYLDQDKKECWCGKA